jgi:LPS export ABC transporter protein LptC
MNEQGRERGAGYGRIVAVWAAALVVGLAGCRGHEENPTGADRTERPPSEGMRGISLQNFHVGDTRWVLQADTASVFREKKRIEVQRMQIDFFERDEHVSTLTADHGVLLQNTDDLEARGNVVVESDEGSILRTEVLFWDHQRSLIHTDEYVEITNGPNVLTGVGLETDPGLERIDIKKQVRGELRDAPEEILGDEKKGSVEGGE